MRACKAVGTLGHTASWVDDAHLLPMDNLRKLRLVFEDFPNNHHDAKVVRRPFGGRLRAAIVGVWIVWIVGQVMRDRTFLTGLCFYLPTPIVLAATLIATITLRRTSKVAFFCGVAFTVITAGHIASVEHRFWEKAGERGGTTLRLVHWNIFRGYAGSDRIRQVAEDIAADIYILSEVPDDFMLADETLTQLRLGNMLVAAKGNLSKPRKLSTLDGLRAFQLTWSTPHGPLRLFAVDMDSSITIHRNPLLTQLTALIDEQQPDLIVGDFNAPRRSAALAQLPAEYKHAYESCGSGWSSTWPVPIPLYAIDQSIHRSTIRPIRYELRSTTLSDHRQQLFEFTVR